MCILTYYNINEQNIRNNCNEDQAETYFEGCIKTFAVLYFHFFFKEFLDLDKNLQSQITHLQVYNSQAEQIMRYDY